MAPLKVNENGQPIKFVTSETGPGVPIPRYHFSEDAPLILNALVKWFNCRFRDLVSPLGYLIYLFLLILSCSLERSVSVA